MATPSALVIIQRISGTQYVSCFISAGGSLPHSVWSGGTLTARRWTDQAGESRPVHAWGRPAEAESAAWSPQLTLRRSSSRHTHTRPNRESCQRPGVGENRERTSTHLSWSVQKTVRGSLRTTTVWFFALTLGTSCYMFICKAVVV